MPEDPRPEAPRIDEKLIDAEIEKELDAAHLKEGPRIKAQPKDKIRKARQILSAQLEHLKEERDPMEPVTSEDGSRFYGTRKAGILFRANGTVSLIRGSQSLKVDWKNVAGRLGALDETIRSHLLKLAIDQVKGSNLTGKKEAKVIAGLRPVYQKGELDPVVFELAATPHFEELHLPGTLAALSAMLSEITEHKFERGLDQFTRRIKAAWAIRNKISNYYDFLVALTEIAQKLGQPPTKGALGGRLGLNAQRMSQVCVKLGYDWLPIKKRGPNLL